MEGAQGQRERQVIEIQEGHLGGLIEKYFPPPAPGFETHGPPDLRNLHIPRTGNGVLKGNRLFPRPGNVEGLIGAGHGEPPGKLQGPVGVGGFQRVVDGPDVGQTDPPQMALYLFDGPAKAAKPDGNRLGFFSRATNEADSSPRSFRIFDLETGLTEDFPEIRGVCQACWNPSSDQVAFLAEGGRRLGIVSVAEKKILSERPMTTRGIERLPGTMAWAKNGRNIAFSSVEESDYALRIYDSSLRTEKVFPIPCGRKPLENLPMVYGAGDKFLVLDFPSSRLWSFDPEKERWKKLF